MPLSCACLPPAERLRDALGADQRHRNGGSLAAPSPKTVASGARSSISSSVSPSSQAATKRRATSSRSKTARSTGESFSRRRRKASDSASAVSACLTLAEAIGAKPPRRLPRWLVRLAAGEVGVVLMTEARGASNRKAKEELGWTLRHPSWRQGFGDAYRGTT